MDEAREGLGCFTWSEVREPHVPRVGDVWNFGGLVAVVINVRGLEDGTTVIQGQGPGTGDGEASLLTDVIEHE